MFMNERLFCDYSFLSLCNIYSGKSQIMADKGKFYMELGFGKISKSGENQFYEGQIWMAWVIFSVQDYSTFKVEYESLKIILLFSKKFLDIRTQPEELRAVGKDIKHVLSQHFSG